MFDRKLIPSQNPGIRQYLQNVLGQVHTTNDIKSLIDKKVEKVSQTIKDKIVKTVTISDYYNQLWKQTDLKQDDKDFAIKSLEKIQKTVKAQIKAGLQEVAPKSANLNVINVDFQMTPFEDFNYQEKLKGIKKHKQLDLESDLFAQHANDKEVLHALNRPFRSVPNLRAPDSLHYTAGLYDIDETEEEKMQKAGEFVKKIKEERRLFVKKMKKVEKSAETRELEELQLFRENEKKEQEQREKERKERLAAHIKELKGRSEARIKESTRWEEEYKASLESKPLFKEIQKRYKKEQLLPELEEKKKKLQELRDFYKPMAREEILEHEKKVLKQLEEKNAERKEQLFENSKWIPQKPAYESKHHRSVVEELKNARRQKDDEKLEVLKKKEKVMELLQEVKDNHLPKNDPQKELELMAVVEQLKKKKDWRARPVQGEEPQEEPDHKKIGAEYLKSVKEMVKNRKPAKTLSHTKDDISASGLMSDRNSKKIPGGTVQSDSAAVQKPRNYLAELRKENKIQSSNAHVDTLINNKKMDTKEKKKLLQSEVEKMEEKTKRKEAVKKFKSKKEFDDNDAEEVDMLYINTIKAKLEMLGA